MPAEAHARKELGRLERMPARNRKDLHDLPQGARRALSFMWLETADDAVQTALTAAGPISGPGFALV